MECDFNLVQFLELFIREMLVGVGANRLTLLKPWIFGNDGLLLCMLDSLCSYLLFMNKNRKLFFFL